MTAQELQLPMQLADLRTILQSHGVVHASVFGSYARGDANEKSDLDLLVELAKDKTYLDLGGLQDELDGRLTGGVDITTRLNHHFAPYIDNDLVEIL
ncbi:MAG: nucleotidyltransferase domain-containing protein [Candidatus Saccharimonadales bacterium]